MLILVVECDMLLTAGTGKHFSAACGISTERGRDVEGTGAGRTPQIVT